MTEATPTLEEWRSLYQAASRVKEMAPWKWMEESDLFGVQNPETNEFGFISVMGMAGEHYAIALYLGPEGLYGFWGLEDAGPFAVAEQVLEIPQLQASFEDRDMLRKQDRAIIKDLGLKFRGRQAWPLFRSYRPGFFPWFLNGEEVRFLTHALEQTLDVAPRFQEDPTLLESTDEDVYLVRVPQQQEGSLAWHDRMMRVPPPEPSQIQIAMDMEALQALKRLPPSQSEVEIDFFKLPEPVREGSERPMYPYMLLMVEKQSGAVIGHELLTPAPSLEEMWGAIPLELVYQLASIGMVPKVVRVRSDLLLQLLQPLAGELRFKLKQSPELPTLDPAVQFLFQRFL
jgi:hypothetical protein